MFIDKEVNTKRTKSKKLLVPGEVGDEESAVLLFIINLDILHFLNYVHALVWFFKKNKKGIRLRKEAVKVVQEFTLLLSPSPLHLRLVWAATGPEGRRLWAGDWRLALGSALSRRRRGPFSSPAHTLVCESQAHTRANSCFQRPRPSSVLNWPRILVRVGYEPCERQQVLV